MASGCDESLKVWDTLTGREVTSFPSPRNDYAFAYNPCDGSLLANTESGKITIWSSEGDEVTTLHGHKSGIYHLAISADGRRLATGGSFSDDRVIVWDMQTKDQLFAILTPRSLTGGGAQGFDLSNDGRLLVVQWADGFALWDLESHEELYRLEQIVDVALIHPNHKQLITIEGNVVIRDLYSGMIEQTREFLTNTSSPVAALSPDGGYLVVGRESGNMDKGSLIILDAATWATIRVIVYPRLLRSVAFSKNGKWLATATAEKEGNLRSGAF